MLSFGAAISACAHSHHWRCAVHLLKLNAADVVGYNGAVDACAKAVVQVQISQLDILYTCIFIYMVIYNHHHIYIYIYTYMYIYIYTHMVYIYIYRYT